MVDIAKRPSVWHQPRPRSIAIVASIMIIFGFAEIITGFTHNFFGLHTAQGAVSTDIGASIGAFYAAAGFVTLTMKRRTSDMGRCASFYGRCRPHLHGRDRSVSCHHFWASRCHDFRNIIAAGFAIFIALQRSAFRQSRLD